MCGKAFRSGQFKEDVVRSIIHSSIRKADLSYIFDKPGIVTPGQTLSGIDKSGKVINSRWGFTGPSKSFVFNTRSENIESPWWKQFKVTRVSVPVSRFFEKDHSFRGKNPVVWLAGITNGQYLSIVTVPAIGVVAKYHHRMPLALADSTIDTWLSGKMPPASLVQEAEVQRHLFELSATA
jgi:putative SOS response-associated peptidase YedK